MEQGPLRDSSIIATTERKFEREESILIEKQVSSSQVSPELSSRQRLATSMNNQSQELSEIIRSLSPIRINSQRGKLGNALQSFRIRSGTTRIKPSAGNDKNFFLSLYHFS